MSMRTFVAGRRDVLKTIGTTVLAAPLASLGGLALAQSQAPRRIDVHHHTWPPEFVAGLKAYGVEVTPVNGWTVSRAVEHNDRAHIIGIATIPATAIFAALRTDWSSTSRKDAWRRLARVSNEYNARIRGDHPGRFGVWAMLPVPDIDGCLREIEYALDVLKADGVGMMTNYAVRTGGPIDRFHGDAIFDPIYEELNRRKTVVYTHPGEAECCDSIAPSVNDAWIEYGVNTTRSMMNLIMSGSTTRFPDIKWIFSHAGGVAPFLVHRFLNGTSEEIVPGIVTKGQNSNGIVGSNYPKNVPRGVLYELKKMHYDTAVAFNPIAMRALRTLVPMSQIVFGADFPYLSSIDTAEGLKNCGVFTDAELRAIDYENMQRLLPQLRS